jgi:hypothetical protein
MQSKRVAMTIFVGLDLSLVSPGLSVYDSATGIWLLYGFAQRVREQGFHTVCGTTEIRLLPTIPNVAGVTPNEARYEHIRSHLVDGILSAYAGAARVVVGIENYAFGSGQQSGHAFKLQELGGVIKHSLWVRYPHWRQVVIPPTSWKRSTVGHGHATKAQVVAYVLEHGPRIWPMRFAFASPVSPRKKKQNGPECHRPERVHLYLLRVCAPHAVHLVDTGVLSRWSCQ